MNIKLPLGFELIISDDPITYIKNTQLQNYNIVICNSPQNGTLNEMYFAINEFKKHILLFVGILSIHYTLHNLDENYKFKWPNSICYNDQIIAQCNIYAHNILHIQIKPVISMKNSLMQLCNQIANLIGEHKMINEHYVIKKMQNLIIREKQIKDTTSFLINNMNEKGDLNILDTKYQPYTFQLSDFIC